jgi:hypothetical protein
MAEKNGGKTEAGPDDIMSPSDMKPILARAKRGQPASCAICLTKDKDGVILLDKRRKPKQLASELKKQAASIDLALDMSSMRFGKASVDTDKDSGLITFTLNKTTSGAMRPKLLARVKRAGFRKVEITEGTA